MVLDPLTVLGRALKILDDRLLMGLNDISKFMSIDAL